MHRSNKFSIEYMETLEKEMLYSNLAWSENFWDADPLEEQILITITDSIDG